MTDDSNGSGVRCNRPVSRCRWFMEWLDSVLPLEDVEDGGTTEKK